MSRTAVAIASRCRRSPNHRRHPLKPTRTSAGLATTADRKTGCPRWPILVFTMTKIRRWLEPEGSQSSNDHGKADSHVYYRLSARSGLPCPHRHVAGRSRRSRWPERLSNTGLGPIGKRVRRKVTARPCPRVSLARYSRLSVLHTDKSRLGCKASPFGPSCSERVS